MRPTLAQLHRKLLVEVHSSELSDALFKQFRDQKTRDLDFDALISALKKIRPKVNKPSLVDDLLAGIEFYRTDSTYAPQPNMNTRWNSSSWLDDALTQSGHKIRNWSYDDIDMIVGELNTLKPGYVSDEVIAIETERLKTALLNNANVLEELAEDRPAFLGPNAHYLYDMITVMANIAHTHDEPEEVFANAWKQYVRFMREHELNFKYLQENVKRIIAEIEKIKAYGIWNPVLAVKEFLDMVSGFSGKLDILYHYLRNETSVHADLANNLVHDYITFVDRGETLNPNDNATDAFIKFLPQANNVWRKKKALKPAIEQFKDNLEAAHAYVDGLKDHELTPEAKKVVTASIELAREVGDADEWNATHGIQFAFRHDGLPLYKELTKILGVDPTVASEESVKRIEDVVKQLSYTGNLRTDVSELEYQIKQIKQARKLKEIKKSPDAQEGFKVFRELISYANQMDHGEMKTRFRNLGPYGVLETQKIWSLMWTFRDREDKVWQQDASSDPFMKTLLLVPEKKRQDFVIDLMDALGALKEGFVEQDAKLKKKVKPEVPKGSLSKAPFQSYIFADQRKGKVPREPNSQHENDVLTMLKSHFNSNKSMDTAVSDELKLMLKKGWYEKILHEPKQAFIFRGMTVQSSWLKNALNWDEDKMLSKSGSKTASFTFTPRQGGSTAWSPDTKVAKDFSGSGDGEYNVILVAKRVNNQNTFLMGPGGLDQVSGLDEFPDEKEAVALGSVRVSKIFWKLAIYGHDWTGVPKPLKDKKKKATKLNAKGYPVKKKTKKSKPTPKKSYGTVKKYKKKG